MSQEEDIFLLIMILDQGIDFGVSLTHSIYTIRKDLSNFVVDIIGKEVSKDSNDPEV